jgi:hypothetical protein
LPTAHCAAAPERPRRMASGFTLTH